MDPIELSVVMPVYNEEGAIGEVVEKWIAHLRQLGIKFEFHVYNDGSKDNTLKILRTAAEKYKELIVHDKANSGHGPTILQGYRENSNVVWILQIDSDDEIEAKWFEDFWKNREQNDFLIGKRKRPAQPLPRKIISKISRFIVRILYGIRVNDVNSPYRLMRSCAFKEIFQSIPGDTFAPNVIISGMVSVRKLRCYEIEVDYRGRVTGEVSIKKWKLLRAAMRSFVQTIQYRFSLSKESLYGNQR